MSMMTACERILRKKVMHMVARADHAAVARTLGRVAQIGPYFALDVPATGSVPLAHLYAPEGSPALAAMVEDHGSRLRTGERRVAGSILFQGLAARLWSPVIGCAGEGLLLDLDPAIARWWRRPEGPIGLHVPDPGGWQLPDPARSAQLVADAVLERHLRPLVHALRRVVRVAEGLLWGNVASALMGAVLVTELSGRDGDGATRALAHALLDLPALRGTGTFGADAEFRRAGCCLYYRVHQGALCGDCGLRAVPTRS